MPTEDLRGRLLTALAAQGRPSSDYDLNHHVDLPPNRKLRQAAVLLAVTPDERVVLTKRSARLKHHPGQIAFPGGKQDPGDPTLIDAALREAEEEVGLSRADVEVLGEMPVHETVTGFQVTPIVALIPQDFTPVPEVGEVEEVFFVPLSHLMDRANYIVEGRIWRGQRRQFFVVPYGPYYIWGATARILCGLADRVLDA